jgi:hypothetical protein
MSLSFLQRAARISVAAAVCATAACAPQPESIAPRYVSPITYQGYQCDQLTEERTRLSREVERVSGLQKENATGDAVMLTVGLVILWPVLIGMAATKDRKDELGKLKGEYEAADAQMKMKQCTAAIPGVVPSTPARAGKDLTART